MKHEYIIYVVIPNSLTAFVYPVKVWHQEYVTYDFRRLTSNSYLHIGCEKTGTTNSSVGGMACIQIYKEELGFLQMGEIIKRCKNQKNNFKGE